MLTCRWRADGAYAIIHHKSKEGLALTIHRFGADIVIEGHDLKLKEGDEVHLFLEYKRDPFKISKGPTKYHFGCDVKENTDTRLVVAFPTSPVLTPELAVGQPGQVARFEFTKRTKKNKTQHGRRADVIFVA